MTMLTPREGQCLAAIKRLTRYNVAPSYDELAADLDTVKSNIHRLVERLKAKGLVEADPNRYWALRIVEANTTADILTRPTPDLRHLRDQVDRLLRKRAWGPQQ